MTDMHTPELEYVFPWVNPNNGNGGSGMTLRDYFAGQALPGLARVSADQANEVYSIHHVVRDAYALADAMITEREKEQP